VRCRWGVWIVAVFLFLEGGMANAQQGFEFLDPLTHTFRESLYSPAYLDSMTINLEPGSGRPYLFSGNGTSFFYGTTKTVADEGWMGLHWGGRKLIDDFLLTWNDKPMDRAEANVSVRPHAVSFRWPDGVVLTILPLGKDRDDLRFTISGGSPEDTFSLFFVLPSRYEIVIRQQNKVQGFLPVMMTADQDTFGVAICSESFFSPVQMRPLAGKSGVNRSLVGKVIQGGMFQAPAASVTLVYGDSYQSIVDRWNQLRGSHPSARAERTQWLLEEVNRSAFRSEDGQINRALAWAKVSMAQLFAEGDSLIWAGLPWFNEGWARDTFISLPGATLVLGKTDASEKILRRFARWQQTDPTSSDFGRLPNRARPDEIIYNTADGTPWFVRELYEYGLYSGDLELWREMMQPGGVVERAIEGAIKHHADDFGFLTHNEADTWMDARGSDGAWSPRGDRAVEIQVLHLTQLEAAVAMGEAVGFGIGTDKRITRWAAKADELRGRLPGAFLRPDSLGLWDHLRPDGTADEKIRPNQLFALTLPLEPIYDSVIRQRILQVTQDSLVYRWGVASLAQTDPEFHPYHATHHYPKDAAYHNGIVWTWLSGPYKSASKQGWAISRNEIEQILGWGLPGSLSENLDAVPRDGLNYPGTSGTISQAWSLAEFIRTWYQDYVGLRPVLQQQVQEGDDPIWSLDPRIPLVWGSFETIIPLLPDLVLLKLVVSVEVGLVDFSLETLQNPTVSLHRNPQIVLFSGSQPADGSWRVMPDVRSFKRAGETDILVPGTDGREHRITLFLTGEEDEPFLQPEVRDGLRSLAPPPWPLLDGRLVKMEDVEARLVHSVADPEGDDDGGEGYGYPTDPLFAPGILDLTDFSLSENGALAFFNLRFRNLIDPGWHPAYGFQLTFATLAIQTGEAGRKRTREVGRNSRFTLPRASAADRFIDIGGGLNLRDAEGTTIAQYLPSDPRYPIGDVPTATLAFAIPIDLIGGDPSNWRITLLVGAQDDHGGAGIGEFREVTPKGGRWEGSGGGPGRSNVYDVLEVQPPR